MYVNGTLWTHDSCHVSGACMHATCNRQYCWLAACKIQPRDDFPSCVLQLHFFATVVCIECATRHEIVIE